jgi:hypothetical protein
LTGQDRHLHANGQSTFSAASELHTTAEARSAVYGHPGLIPGGLLAALAHCPSAFPWLAPSRQPEVFVLVGHAFEFAHAVSCELEHFSWLRRLAVSLVCEVVRGFRLRAAQRIEHR